MKQAFSFLTILTMFSIWAERNPETPEPETKTTSAIMLSDGTIVRATEIEGVYLYGEEVDSWESTEDQGEMFYIPHDLLIEMRMPAGGGGIVEKGTARPSFPAGGGGFADKGTVTPSYPAGSGGYTLDEAMKNFLVDYALDGEGIYQVKGGGAGSGGIFENAIDVNALIRSGAGSGGSWGQ